MNEYIATFHTHLSAMLTFQALKDAGCRAKMQPVPRTLSSSAAPACVFGRKATAAPCSTGHGSAVRCIGAAYRRCGKMRSDPYEATYPSFLLSAQAVRPRAAGTGTGAVRPRVLLTTSTHIYPVAPPDSRALLIAPEADELLDALASPGIVCAGRAATDASRVRSRLTCSGRLSAQRDITLCEADGAHHLPLKLHRADEPVVPLESDLCLIIAGLSAWDSRCARLCTGMTAIRTGCTTPQRRVGADKNPVLRT